MLRCNIPPQKLFGWFQRTWAVGDWQLHHNNMPAHASWSGVEFFDKHQIIQVTQPPLQPRFGALQLLPFPKTKSTFEREEISDHRWDSGKYNGVADGYWENCVRSQGAYFEGDWGIIILCAMFLVSGTFNKCLCFSYYMAGCLLDRPHILCEDI